MRSLLWPELPSLMARSEEILGLPASARFPTLKPATLKGRQSLKNCVPLTLINWLLVEVERLELPVDVPTGFMAGGDLFKDVEDEKTENK